MEIREASLLASAPSREHWPDSDLPEIVLAGRSNVGKSSLINCLCQKKALAYVGKTPGKTRLLNFFQVNRQFVLVDVPGYGYANASHRQLMQFGAMMEEYFGERSQLKGLLLLADLRHKPTSDDVTMAEFARYHGIPFVIAATKADKVPRSRRHAQLQLVASTLDCDIQDVLPFSSVTQEGREAVLAAMEQFIHRK